MMLPRRVVAWYLAIGLTATLGAGSLAALAQGRGHGHDDDHHFSDHDRQEVHGWEEHHHEHPPKGFRDQDRLPPELEARLQIGVVLDRDLRDRARPVPHDLLVVLTPPPPRYRYFVIGDHVCLVDGGYHLVDVLHLELNF